MREVLLFSLVGLLVSVSPVAQAGPWEDFTGILTDPIKLDSTSEKALQSIEIMTIHAERLLDKGDKMTAEHIAAVDTALNETRNWATAERKALIDGVSVSFDRLETIQKTFFSETQSILRCSVVVTGREFRQTVADSLNDLGASRPRFTVFGLKIGEIKLDSSHIPSPIKGFRQARALYDQRISEIDLDSSPVILVDAYAEVQRLADRARCHYRGDSRVYDELYKVELIYKRKARPWKWLNRGV
ncbi:hypothetical protein [Granulosicoccus antarcticus]|uniref:Uncharacterized protein n=1 Tax=Granulosicoccus antarcticus IMCC3135 TaxID=1192854 RepID=A0A2Z2NVX2_9GAMM|nr:hypothetical protein [Granulosicoccus antarcticus]ASJ73868.1 hypothetical protein IMCC3135_18945 [Granulosicoccus antarcticus IMCC3135]